MTSIIPPAELEDFIDSIADRVAERLAKRPRLVDRHTLAGLIGLSIATIERRVRDGSIPVIRIGNRVLFDVGDVVAALKTGGIDMSDTQRAE